MENIDQMIQDAVKGVFEKYDLDQNKQLDQAEIIQYLN